MNSSKTLTSSSMPSYNIGEIANLVYFYFHSSSSDVYVIDVFYV